MRAEVRINMDNPSFSDIPHKELARILSMLAERLLERGLENFTLMDLYGNKVGGLIIVDEYLEAKKEGKYEN